MPTVLEICSRARNRLKAEGVSHFAVTMPLGVHYLPQEFGFVVMWQNGLITCGGYVWTCLKKQF